jgi:hypothetical protein
MIHRLIAAAFALLASSVAFARTPTAKAPPVGIAPAGPLPVETAPEHTQLALSPLTWSEPVGQGFSLAFENGAWGERWSQGLRIGVPLGRHAGVNARGLFLSGIDPVDDGPFTADAGGRIDVIGRSYPLLNVVRLYGGGGVQVFVPAFNLGDRKTRVGGGGHFGFEFFQSPYLSFFVEVGGQGGLPAPGATILAGMAFYPWTK